MSPAAAGSAIQPRAHPRSAAATVAAGDFADDADDPEEKLAREEEIAARHGVPTGATEHVGPLVAGSMVGLGRLGHNPQRTLHAMDYSSGGRSFAEYKATVVALIKEYVVEADLDACLA